MGGLICEECDSIMNVVGCIDRRTSHRIILKCPVCEKELIIPERGRNPKNNRIPHH